MIIYPAIDLRNGECVRLTKGDFSTSHVYNTNPLAMAELFTKEGAEWLHVVDLDGAQQGAVQQSEIIAHLAHHCPLPLQTGGGVRSAQDIDTLLQAGARRVIIGSVCVTHPNLVNEWFSQFGAERLVLALDCIVDDNQTPFVKTHGWQQQSALTLWDILDLFPRAKHLLCTDISKDGMLQGPNFSLYTHLRSRFLQLEIQASGGVSSLDHVKALKKLGIQGVIIGKALYEGLIRVKEAIAC